MRRRWCALVVVGVIAAACSPPPTPSGPKWVTTRLAWSTGPAGTVSRIGAWTDEDWFATVEYTAPPPDGGSPSARLLFFPRSGPNGSVLGAPQVVLPESFTVPGPIGEHIVAVGDQTQHFYRETGGIWSEAGSLAVPMGFQPMSMTDRWFGLRRAPGDPGWSGDGEVRIYAVDGAGPSVVATPATTLAPDPAWPAGLREGFGRDLAIDGDLAVVSAVDLMDPTAGAVRVYRATAGTWTSVQTLSGTAGETTGFGSVVAVDDGPSVDRIVVLTYDPIALVRVYADTGSGFALEQDLRPDPSTIGTGQSFFGSAMSIDGERLVLADRATEVASSTPGHAPTRVAHVAVFRHGSTWTRETDVRTFTTPYDPGVISAYPYRLQLVGDHVAATLLVSPDPPPGCGFICLNWGFEAWSLDRR